MTKKEQATMVGHAKKTQEKLANVVWQVDSSVERAISPRRSDPAVLVALIEVAWKISTGPGISHRSYQEANAFLSKIFVDNTPAPTAVTTITKVTKPKKPATKKKAVKK